MIQLPPSKSIASRYLVATFFNGTLPADPLFEDNDDLMVLQQALLEIYSDEEPIDYGDSPIDVGASGTALRFVTAVCASTPGADYVVAGTPRLMQRPMTPLIDLLKEARAVIETMGENGTGPYRVKGGDLKGGNFSIRGDISSQFISALMLVAPRWEKGLNLSFSTPLVSRPYIEMTSSLIRSFGIKVNLTDKNVEVEAGKYKIPEDFQVEADWSSASFFYEASALGVKDIKIENLVSPVNSLQGDSATAKIFASLGVKSVYSKEGAILDVSGECHAKVEVDFKDTPDLVLPFAVACLLRDVKFRFENVAHLRIKESDRLASLVNESKKLGFIIKEGDNFLEWDGEKTASIENPLIETYDDHRVAMAFAMAALKVGSVRISNPQTVEKSFIDFWNQIPKVGLSCTLENDIMTVTHTNIAE